MFKFKFLLLSCAFILPAYSFAGLSPVRLKNQSYFSSDFHPKRNNRAHLRMGSLLDNAGSTSPEAVAVPLEVLDQSKINGIESYDLLVSEFNFIRDTAFLDSEGDVPQRRITWLYPDDGCYARAEIAAEKIENVGHIKTNKIFAFGNLTAKTQNSPDGSVSWWYHVAVTLRVNDTAYVFDPAIDPSRPMPLINWAQAISSSQDDSVLFSICAKDTYDPDADCYSPSPVEESFAISEQNEFLDPEWQRILELNRNPKEELGDYPPWK